LEHPANLHRAFFSLQKAAPHRLFMAVLSRVQSKKSATWPKPETLQMPDASEEFLFYTKNWYTMRKPVISNPGLLF